jgi:hypothetical protein
MMSSPVHRRRAGSLRSRQRAKASALGAQFVIGQAAQVSMDEPGRAAGQCGPVIRAW